MIIAHIQPNTRCMFVPGCW